MAIITLTTDFGLRDPYVGEVKGAVLTVCPAARLVDITHEISPGDVHEASWALSRVWARFPEETVHLAVVDPGVGSERLPVAVRSAGRWFVGPDNGVLSAILDRTPPDAAFAIDASRFSTDGPSDTFHGRDIFAPAAARLACGEPGDTLGSEIEPERLVHLETEGPSRDGPLIAGRVVHVDRFGNLVTNIPTDWLSNAPSVTISGRVVEGIEHSYTAVPAGVLLLTLGSGGMLEISARGTSAAALLGVGRGEPVIVQ